jgi:hypothetical protein
MESIEPKIVAAIAGAITAYTEETALWSVSEKKKEALPPVEPINLWGIAGRQDLMLQRKIWQLRLCK